MLEYKLYILYSFVHTLIVLLDLHLIQTSDVILNTCLGDGTAFNISDASMSNFRPYIALASKLGRC